jgi:pimeloyl-ACP methyl ester carboxylesterase
MFSDNKAVNAAWKGKKLQMPVLYLYSDNDAAVTANTMHRIGTIAKSIHIQVLPNCSHWIQQDAPAMVNHLLRKLIRGELPVSAL